MRILLFLNIILYSHISFAGAWLLEPNKYELILQQEYKFLTTYYISKPGEEAIASKIFSFETYDSFLQYGINEKLNIGLQAKWYNYKGYSQNYSENTTEFDYFESNELAMDSEFKEYENNLFETKFFAQTPLWKNKNSIISLQPNISFYTKNFTASGGVALLYGKSFKVGKRNVYINLEVGADVSHSISTKYEATLGYDLTKKYSVMLQSFNRQNTKFYNTNADFVEYFNDMKASLIYKYNKFLFIQTGFSTNITQRNSYVADSFITTISVKL